MDDSLVRLMSIDVLDARYKEVILRLCKLNDFQWLRVYLHLHGAATPPGYDLHPNGKDNAQELKDILLACDMHAILALDSTVTKKNPNGKEKVVGFVLYQINRDTKSELEVLFLLIDKGYRKKGHGWNLMKKCEELHLFFIHENNHDPVLDENMSCIVSLAQSSNIKVNIKERGEKICGHLFSSSGHDLVQIFTVKVYRDDTVIKFWTKLGYIDAHTLPGMWTRNGYEEWVKAGEDHKNIVVMTRAGPQTTAYLHDKGRRQLV